jgi:SAM-dependent methyltransferase
VIASMTEHTSYIHGTEPSEQERLAALNRLTNAAFIEFLNVRPGTQVLEVGSGLGLLAAGVAAAAPEVQVVGIEQSAAQIGAAVKDPRIRYVQGDAHHLEFADQTFDLVYARYVLEHVTDPAKVLKEMKRVSRMGARIVACGNDVSLMRVDPPCPIFESVWLAFQELQQQLGGDSHVGRRLFRLFRAADLSAIELSVQPDVHWYGSAGFSRWIQNLIGNVESARAGLAGAGFCPPDQIDAAVAELEALQANPEASSSFAWNRATATRS